MADSATSGVGLSVEGGIRFAYARLVATGFSNPGRMANRMTDTSVDFPWPLNVWRVRP